MTTNFEAAQIQCIEVIHRELQAIKADIRISRFIIYLLLKQGENPKKLLEEFLENRDNFLGQIKDVDTHVLARHYEDYAKLVQGWIDVIQENQEQKKPCDTP